MKKIKKKLNKWISNLIEIIKEEPENLYKCIYIISVINFIVALILTIMKVGIIKDVDEYFTDKNILRLTNMTFNSIFIGLCIGVLVLYLFIVLVKYFKGKKKSKLINFVLILTLIFLVIDILILVAVNHPNKLIIPIVEKLTFNLEGNGLLSIVLLYFALPIVGVTSFLGLSRGSESVKSFIVCLLINTLGLFFVTFIIGGVVFPLMSSSVIIITCIIAIPYMIRFLLWLTEYTLITENIKNEK